MSTTPTNQPVPSEKPQDLKFNAGKIDEFVTSMARQYIDRFGHEHYTIEGISWVAQQAIAAFGYITMDSFEDGNTLTLPNQVLRYEATGEYYRWDGDFPKTVPAGSTPETSGGVGQGKWLSVGDATLRTEIMRGQFKYEGADSVYYVPNINFDTSVDNRDTCYDYPSKIYIPRDVTIRVNFLPDDDVRKFVGEGKIISKNIWYGTDIQFDVDKSTNGVDGSVKAEMYRAVRDQTSCNIGVLGDSISDGAWGKQDWSSPPIDANGNFVAPSTYNHRLAGGSHSWVNHFQQNLNVMQSRWSRNAIFQTFNCSLNASKLSDGWAYRNFDYGFFGNSAYGSKAPRILLLAHGWNDSTASTATYRDQLDMMVRKAWGYGCYVGIVTVNDNDPARVAFEQSTKKWIAEKLGLDYFNLGIELTSVSNTSFTDNKWFYVKKEGTYDTTHPQELGHMSMGDAMFMQTLGEKYALKVRPGDLMGNSAAGKYWAATSYPSGTALFPTFGAASATSETAMAGYLPLVTTNGESVAFTTQVYCDEDNMSLTIYEPYTGTAVVGYANSLNISQPSGLDMPSNSSYLERNVQVNARKKYKNTNLASKIFGGGKTLSTYVGQLRKGLNTISITMDARMDKVWYPILQFGNVSLDGVRITENRLVISGNATNPTVLRRKSSIISDQMIKDVMVGGGLARSADHSEPAGSIIQHLRCTKGLTSNGYFVMNFCTIRNTGIVVGIASDGSLAMGTYLGSGEPADWTLKSRAGGFMNKPFDVWVYLVGNEYSYTMECDGESLSFTTSKVYGGYLGSWNRSSSTQTYQYTYDVTSLNVG